MVAYRCTKYDSHGECIGHVGSHNFLSSLPVHALLIVFLYPSYMDALLLPMAEYENARAVSWYVGQFLHLQSSEQAIRDA